MKFALKMSRLGTETAFEVLAKVVKLRGEGKDVVSFCIGEPDFDTPENIKQAGIRAIEENQTHYGPTPGLPEFKQEIAKYISKTRNIDVSPEEVVVAPGGKPLIYYCITTLVDEGDEVIYPSPGYPIYESVINFVNAKAVPLPILESKEFTFDVEDLKKLVNEKTKLLIINSPSNPTGGVLTDDDFEEIAKLAKEYDFYVFADEIYSRIIYDGEFKSISSLPGMKERTLILDGHSKTYAMTGWRLGYGIMNKEWAEAVAKLQNNISSCTATFTQLAGMEAYKGSQDAAEKMVSKFKGRRDLIVELLNDIPGMTCLKPKGAFYVFPNVTEICKKYGFKGSEQIVDYLLYEGGVAVLSRVHFGDRLEGENEEYIRLSYATSQEEIKKGLKRMKDALTDEERIKKWLSEQ